MSISNVKRPDVSFIRTDNKAEAATDDLFIAYNEGNWTPLTFTAPSKGGSMSDQDYRDFLVDIAKHKKAKRQKTGKAELLLTTSMRKWYLLYQSEAKGLAFKKVKRKASKPVADAMQADLTSAQEKVGRAFGEYKRKAEGFDKRKDDGKKGKAPNKVAPTIERISKDVNRDLGWIIKDLDMPNRIKIQAALQAAADEVKAGMKMAKQTRK
jgi:hypothetical protein